MKRDFLKNLGLEDEIVDKIMAEYGKSISTEKAKIDDLNSKLEVNNVKMKEYEDKIATLEQNSTDNATKLKDLETLTNENKDLKAQLQMGDSNVKKEFSKFVRTEIMSKVDDKNDFETVLKNYKKENPQYFGDTVIKKVQSSPNLNGGEPQAPTTNSIMNDILRSAIN